MYFLKIYLINDVLAFIVIPVLVFILCNIFSSCEKNSQIVEKETVIKDNDDKFIVTHSMPIKTPYVTGIYGGSDSGKTFITKK